MGARTGISLEEYLRTSFDGLDREYVEGEVVERTMPDFSHGHTQSVLGSIFVRLNRQFPVHVASELRLRISPEVVRIADVCVFAPDPPAQRHPTSPPLIVIEIVSPDDRHDDIVTKLDEYARWGVPHVWLVDPQLRKCYVYGGGLREVTAFELPEFQVQIAAAEIFA